MEVFISWSGTQSHYVAKCLYEWLRKVIQTVKPWMSSESILAGERWNQKIAEQLSQTKFGVICVTPENLTAEWLIFEAGALAKTIEKTYVCTYLVGLKEIDARNPLSQFQYKHMTKDGTYAVVHSMHQALRASNKEIDLKEEEVKEAFDQWWPKLEAQLKEIPAEPGALKEEKKPDTLVELVALTKDIARSVSDLQARANTVPVTQVVRRMPHGTFVTGLPGTFATGYGYRLPGSISGPFDTLMSGDVMMVGGGPALEGDPELTKNLERIVREQVNDMVKLERTAVAVPPCPNCGQSDAVKFVGLAKNVDDGKARHLTAGCHHCSDRQFGVHVSRADKALSACPADCPFHPPVTKSSEPSGA